MNDVKICLSGTYYDKVLIHKYVQKKKEFIKNFTKTCKIMQNSEVNQGDV